VNPSREVKCYECGGVGHIHADCGNLIKSKGRAFNVTQSDESDQEEKDENVANYVAFGVSYDSQDDVSSPNLLMVIMVFVIMNQKRRVICKKLITICIRNTVK
jgi:hypothetical protein